MIELEVMDDEELMPKVYVFNTRKEARNWLRAQGFFQSVSVFRKQETILNRRKQTTAKFLGLEYNKYGGYWLKG